MLDLPDITVLAVSTDDAKAATAMAVRRTLAQVNAGGLVIAADDFAPFSFPTFPNNHQVFTPRFPSYEYGSVWAMTTLPVLDCFTTSHLLTVHWDGFVVNPDAWTPEFLEYDYVGAVWANGAVGNGGFCLKSQRFLQAVRMLNLLATVEACFPDDALCCMLHHDGKCGYRPALEASGVRFAPPELARRFSVENEPYQSSFGFHGVQALASVVRRGLVDYT